MPHGVDLILHVAFAKKNSPVQVKHLDYSDLVTMQLNNVDWVDE